MGVNAYRCSHNAPSPVILDACDELGMLVMDETRAFGTSPEALRQLTDVIERDRNHPCVFIWSLGNEEHTAQDTPLGARILEKATRIAKQLDPSRPVTYGANNGPRFAGANSVAQVRGVNYIRIGAPTGQVWDTYHSEHPDQPIIGTEESSYVLSRGGGANDFENRTLDSFGNVTMPWGSTPKGWVKYIENRDYFSGAFMWTGFDYRGEPAPFIQNNSSSFGTIDLCGMEKPPFYYYKAWWTNEPVLKLAPHWNYTVGQTVTIAAYTNCESITLSLNGKVLQTRTVERFDAPMFSVVFEPGVLSVDGIYNGQHIHDELITSKDVKNILCKEVLAAQNDSDVAIYELTAYDENGVFCPLCSETVELVAENGRIIGVGNGDPSNYDYERKPVKEEIKIITDIKDGEDTVVIPPKKPNEYVSRAQTHYIEQPTPFFDDDYRLLRTTVSGDKLTKTLTLTVDGVEGYDYIEIERLGGKSKVYHNGKLLGNNLRCNGTHGLTSNRPHRFYTDFSSGTNVITVESECTAVDLPIISGQVKVGKVIDTPWHVKLHYGKARVFVKYTNKDTFALNIK